MGSIEEAQIVQKEALDSRKEATGFDSIQYKIYKKMTEGRK